MSSPSPLNVFRGSDALAQYLDPDQNPPLPLVELPDALNPLRSDGIRIFAKIFTAQGAQNVKSLPALNMLLNEPRAKSQSIVEASSGSTVLSLGIIARALWGHEDVHAYVTNKKHPDSLRLLRFLGLKVVLYGGLAQQEPSDPKGIMCRLRRLAGKDPNICYPGQYDNDYNWKSHEQWTGTQIWKQLPEINIFCATVGTGGCLTGTGVYLKSKKPSIKVVGVCNVFGDPTPGPRHFPGFESSTFPWRETIDAFEEVSSVNSYRTSMKLSRHGIIAGPSSGESLQGLLAYLYKAKAESRLSDLRDPATGEINCVFACADLPYQYIDAYYQKLGEDEFPPIYNKELLTCDLDPYDERWFLFPNQASALLSHVDGGLLDDPFCPMPSKCGCTPRLMSAPSTPSSPTNSTASSLSSEPSTAASSPVILPYHPNEHPPLCAVTLLDIRPTDAFASSHFRNARSAPLPGAQADLYGNAKAVQRRWVEIKEMVEVYAWLWGGNDGYGGHDEDSGEARNGSCTLLKGASGKRRKGSLLVLCADGDSGRMAVAMLRAKGCDAFCVEGGYEALAKHLRDEIMKAEGEMTGLGVNGL